MLVYTTLGLVPHEQLNVQDITEWHDNARVTATEWRKDGELVRRDVHVNILRGHDLIGEQASI